MTTLPIVLDELDLAKPDDFLLALYRSESWPRPASVSFQRYQRDLPIVERHHSAVFGVVWDELAAQATWDMIGELGGAKAAHDMQFSTAPREWLAVFRAAFEMRAIGPAQWGAALAFLLTVASGNGTPELPASSLAAKHQMLADVRSASPAGLMEPYERKLLADLPETVAIFRGGYTLASQAGERLDVARSGLHWAFDRGHADTYMRGRGCRQTVRSLRASVTSLPYQLAGLGKIASVGALAIDHVPFLIRADVPRELIMALHIRGNEDLAEALVDFERITADMVQDITPESHRWAA